MTPQYVRCGLSGMLSQGVGLVLCGYSGQGGFQFVLCCPPSCIPPAGFRFGSFVCKHAEGDVRGDCSRLLASSTVFLEEARFWFQAYLSTCFG